MLITAMRHRLVAALIAASLMIALSSLLGGAQAQFGSIFGAPPRPPASVPNGRQQADPDTYPPPYSPAPPQQYPAPSSPPYAGRSGAAPGAVQSQPLPPPPGASGNSNPTLSSLPPGSQRQPGRPASPADAAAPPDDDESITQPPSQKIANNSALFSGLDKITGRIINFDVAIGETVQFGALQVTPRACYTRPPTETANTDAFVEVDEVTLEGEIKRIFTGWMFAASPGLHGVEHAIYDVWLTDCKNPVQAAITPAPEPSAPPPPPRAGANPPQRSPQPRAVQPSQQRRPAPPPALPPN